MGPIEFRITQDEYADGQQWNFRTKQAHYPSKHESEKQTWHNLNDRLFKFRTFRVGAYTEEALNWVPGG